MCIQEKANTTLPILQKQLREVNKGLANILDAIQKKGLSAPMQQRYKELEKQKSELEISIKAEQLRERKLTREEAIFWLEGFRNIDMSNIDQRQMLVSIFVNAVYVFDDRLVIVYNFKENARTAELAEVICAFGNGSDIACFAPQINAEPVCWFGVDSFQKNPENYNEFCTYRSSFGKPSRRDTDSNYDCFNYHKRNILRKGYGSQKPWLPQSGCYFSVFLCRLCAVSFGTSANHIQYINDSGCCVDRCFILCICP